MSVVSVVASSRDEVDAGSPRWLGIRLQHLIALETVARTGSFMRAASALGYSQSAISQQIATLENVAGTRLLTRRDGLAPTRAGEVVLRRARSVRQQFASLDAELDALTGARWEAVRVVTHHPAATSFFADALRGLGSRADSGQLVARIATSAAALLHELGAGISDLGLAVVPAVVDTAFVVEPLAELPLEIVSSAAANAGDHSSVTDLAGSRLLCLSECPATERLLCELVEREIPHEVCVRADDAATLLELARRGDGLALLPRVSNDGVEAGVVRCPLEGRFTVVVSFVWSAGRPPGPECAQILELVRVSATRSERR